MLNKHDDLDTLEASHAFTTIVNRGKINKTYSTRRNSTVIIAFVDLPRPNRIEINAPGQELVNAA